MAGKQNLTVQLDRETIRKAKILAATQGTSVSQLVAAQIEASVRNNDVYAAARRDALDFLDRGFHLGGRRFDRDALHER